MAQAENVPGGFYQGVLGAFQEEASPVEERNLPRQTILGQVIDVFTGTSDELPAWLEKNKPSTHPEKGQRTYLEVLPGFDLKREVITTSAYGKKAIHSFIREAEEERARTGEVKGLKDLAGSHRIRDGKWFCFFHREVIDEVWGRVATAVVNGSLPSRRASVGLETDAEEKHILSVYVNDFRNMRVRENLETGVREVLRKPQLRMLFRPLFVSYYLSFVDEATQQLVKKTHRDWWSRGEASRQKRDKARKSSAQSDSSLARVAELSVHGSQLPLEKRE